MIPGPGGLEPGLRLGPGPGPRVQISGFNLPSGPSRLTPHFYYEFVYFSQRPLLVNGEAKEGSLVHCADGHLDSVIYKGQEAKDR